MEKYRQSLIGLLAQFTYVLYVLYLCYICYISIVELFYAAAVFEKPVLNSMFAHIFNLNMSVILKPDTILEWNNLIHFGRACIKLMWCA